MGDEARKRLQFFILLETRHRDRKLWIFWLCRGAVEVNTTKAGRSELVAWHDKINKAESKNVNKASESTATEKPFQLNCCKSVCDPTMHENTQDDVMEHCITNIWRDINFNGAIAISVERRLMKKIILFELRCHDDIHLLRIPHESTRRKSIQLKCWMSH